MEIFQVRVQFFSKNKKPKADADVKKNKHHVRFRFFESFLKDGRISNSNIYGNFVHSLLVICLVIKQIFSKVTSLGKPRL